MGAHQVAEYPQVQAAFKSWSRSCNLCPNRVAVAQQRGSDKHLHYSDLRRDRIAFELRLANRRRESRRRPQIVRYPDDSRTCCTWIRRPAG
jgi:hypothetical protein